MSLKIKLTKGAQPLSKGSVNSAAYDLKSVQELTIEPQERKCIETGIQMAIPLGYYGQVLPRSGMALNSGIVVMGGVIDPDYRGEVKVILYNSSDRQIKININDKIAQIAFIKLFEDDIEVVETLDETIRDTQGFGSTGN